MRVPSFVGVLLSSRAAPVPVRPAADRHGGAVVIGGQERPAGTVERPEG
ncbi:hypothetical protein SLI_6897 [Streptomyces lividans 1326]|uniref:Uncharacterized protein n=1 Tax=Streptomyces lividans 1326 TaxID=1200984 RepID=A0A7U9DYW3_STRLI|nr:hypothetical protein SLI_6897 [Streptomyces lividans 1326]